MSTLVIVCRAISLLAFAGPMVMGVGPRRGAPESREPKRRTSQWRHGRLPVVANFASFGLFFSALIAFSGSANGFTALLMASLGVVLALGGAALVLRSRAELGRAWSLVPNASQETGLVTSGPYRLIRHPIYLGLALLAMGQALAFSSWPAVAIALCGIVPTFAWRARAEERLLGRTFREGFEVYRRRTRMIVPHLL